MKRLSALIIVLSVTVFFGCAQEKPEAAAQKIFEDQLQVAGHQGLQMDASDLDYTIVEQSEGRALVEVSGLMPVKATLPLVNERGRWVLDTAPAVDVPEKAAAAH